MVSGLGHLSDPKNSTAPVDLLDTTDAAALNMLGKMVLIRRAEEEIAKMVEAGEIKCPCHFAIGQEATAVGVAAHLRPTDRGFGGHRSHAHYLASGGSIDKLMAEVLGRATGASKGMGGSMHLFGADFGFAGSVPIVAGTVPLAVGAGLAAKMDGSNDIGIAYFGDGACEEGVVHEALNLAAVMKIPVLFVVENNLYASHLDIKLRQPNDSVARFAKANEIPTRVVDGNDVIAVSKAAGELIRKARSGEGPGFIEAVTYRWRGHVGPDENVDVGIRRSADEIAAWKLCDPIARLKTSLVEKRISTTIIEDHLKKIDEMVCAARAAAYDAPWPANEDLFNHVYSKTERQV